MALSTKRHTAFLLRLPVSLKQEAFDFAKEDGTSLNHFISLAVAEKIARIQSTPPAPITLEGAHARRVL